MIPDTTTLKERQARAKIQRQKWNEMIEEIRYKDKGEPFRRNELFKKVVMPAL